MERLDELFKRYYNKTANDSEREELMGLIRSASTEDLSRVIMAAGMELNIAEFTMDETQAEIMLQRILDRTEAPVKKMNRIGVGWFRIAAAASLIGLLFFTGYLLFVRTGTGSEDQTSKIVTKDDVKAPASNSATITLANGQTVYLGDAANKMLIQQKGIDVVKLADGQIVYKGTTTDLVYNTLNNPRGSKVIEMTLADGSRVWLNAGSSVTFPISFIGNERKVSITGEAYFEVTHDKARPFYVSSGDVQVKVLGTHFNVNAYDDEDALKVTLLEGSVRVSNNNNAVTIKPGQQASSIHHSSFIIHNSPDLDAVMAWKNGLFAFSHDNIQTVMRQLAKWYDLEVKFEGNITTDKFGGDISRDLPLTEVLEFLKASQVNFEVQGRTVIVKP